MKKIICTTIILIMLISCCSSVFASSDITKSDLQNYIQEINKTMDEDEQIMIDDEKIIYPYLGTNYNIYYNLGDEVAFSNRLTVSKDFDIEEYMKNSQQLSLGLMGFIIYCGAKNVDESIATVYSMKEIFSSDLLLSVSQDLVTFYDSNSNKIVTPKQMIEEHFETEQKEVRDYFTINAKTISSTEDQCVLEIRYVINTDKISSLNNKTYSEVYNELITAEEEFLDKVIGTNEEYKSQIESTKNNVKRILEDSKKISEDIQNLVDDIQSDNNDETNTIVDSTDGTTRTEKPKDYRDPEPSVDADGNEKIKDSLQNMALSDSSLVNANDIATSNVKRYENKTENNDTTEANELPQTGIDYAKINTLWGILIVSGIGLGCIIYNRKEK